MSNEANLRGQSRAWLVFGVDNKSRKVVGTNFRSKTEHLQNLKYEISQRIEPTITLRNIHVLEEDGKRVILFEIPAASWSLQTFLDRAKLTQDGKITRTTLLLLGRAESAWRLSPHPAQLTWKLDSEEKAYEHFSPPFLLATSLLYRRIRNIQNCGFSQKISYCRLRSLNMTKKLY